MESVRRLLRMLRREKRWIADDAERYTHEELVRRRLPTNSDRRGLEIGGEREPGKESGSKSLSD
jgi:hypothetical protein